MAIYAVPSQGFDNLYFQRLTMALETAEQRLAAPKPKILTGDFAGDTDQKVKQADFRIPIVASMSGDLALIENP